MANNFRTLNVKIMYDDDNSVMVIRFADQSDASDHQYLRAYYTRVYQGEMGRVNAGAMTYSTLNKAQAGEIQIPLDNTNQFPCLVTLTQGYRADGVIQLDENMYGGIFMPFYSRADGTWYCAYFENLWKYAGGTSTGEYDFFDLASARGWANAKQLTISGALSADIPIEKSNVDITAYGTVDGTSVSVNRSKINLIGIKSLKMAGGSSVQNVVINNARNMSSVQVGTTSYTEFPATIPVPSGETVNIGAYGKADPMITISYKNTDEPVIKKA